MISANLLASLLLGSSLALGGPDRILAPTEAINFRGFVEETEASVSLQALDSAGKPLPSPRWHLVNRQAGLRVYVAEEGLDVRPRDFAASPWSVRFSLMGPASESITGEGKRITVSRGHTIEYVDNRPGGIEHSFLVGEGTEARLVLDLQVRTEGIDRVGIGPHGGLSFFADGKEVLTYGRPTAFDARGREIASGFSLSEAGDILSIHVDDEGEYPILIDPTLTNPVTVESNQDGALFGYFVCAAGDVNNDGFGDIIVGAPFFDGGVTDQGAAFLFFGPSLTPATSPILGPHAGSAFGWSVCTALNFDLDSNNHGDVVIGAPLFSGANQREGAAFVYFGAPAPGGISPQPPWMVPGGFTDSRMGSCVGSAGDVNGDGGFDVIVGAAHHSTGTMQQRGAAALFLGSVTPDTIPGTTPAWVERGENLHALFGLSVDTAIDVNNDGFGDVIVGSPGFGNGQANEGGVYVFFGRSTSGGGLPLSTIGDGVSWRMESNQKGAQLGFFVTTAGDVDGDGFFDVIAGAPLLDCTHADEGGAFLWLGRAGPAPAFSWSTVGGQPNARYGHSVCLAGRVNGDQFWDILVGAPLFDGPGGIDEGKVYMFLGSPTGPRQGPPGCTSTGELFADCTFTAGQANARLGWSISGAGDLNANGLDAVILGAPWFDNVEFDEGRAFVFDP